MHWVSVSSLASPKERGAAKLKEQQAFHLPLRMDRKTSIFCWKAVNPKAKRLSNGARRTRLAVISRPHGTGIHRVKATASTDCSEIRDFTFD